MSLCVVKNIASILLINLLRDHPSFSAFSQEYREYARGEAGKSSCTLLKNVGLSYYTCSLANQHFYSTLLGRREARIYKKSSYALYACETAENYG